MSDGEFNIAVIYFILFVVAPALAFISRNIRKED